MTSDLSASVIVPVFNGTSYLPQFWHSLLPNLNEKTELIIVNDGSTENVDATLPGFPDGVRVIRLDNDRSYGYATAVNRGMSVASGDILVHLNTDLVLSDDFLPRLQAALLNQPNAGIVGARLLYPQSGLIQHMGVAFSESNKYHVYEHLHPTHPLVGKTREVQATTGAAIALTRRLYRRTGPLDECFYNMNEDIDYCLRAKTHGFKIYVTPDATAYHWQSQSGPARFVHTIDNEALFWTRWGAHVDPDMLNYIREAITHLKTCPGVDMTAPYTFLNLSKGRNDGLIIHAFHELCPKLKTCPVIEFSQRNNPEDILRLPMILPYSLMLTATPFIYIVDSYKQLENNIMWFKTRKQFVIDEVIADHKGCVVTTLQTFARG